MREMARTADEIAVSGSLATGLSVPPTQDDTGVLAETLNRMLDRLAAGVPAVATLHPETSHELRTPITICRPPRGDGAAAPVPGPPRPGARAPGRRRADP